MGHLQPSSADGLRGHRSDRHALWEEDRLKEEELGSLPSLPDGDGPDLHPRDGQGCAAYPGQEMLCQGLVPCGTHLAQSSDRVGECGGTPCCSVSAEAHLGESRREKILLVNCVEDETPPDFVE